MTREEAIEALNEIFDDSDYSRFDGWYGTAMKMAIEALLKMEVIQDVIDMPFEWEQDDRRRYSRVVNIVKMDLLQEVGRTMTREEAAQTISDLIIAAEDEEGPCLWSDQIKALEIAIEALKQQEQEKDKWNIPSAYPPNSIILEGGKLGSQRKVPG